MIKRTIRQKIQASLCVVCFIPLIVTTIGSYTYTRKIIRNNLGYNTEQALDTVNSDVSDYMREYMRIVRTASQSHNFDGTMKSMQSNNDTILHMYYSDEQGDITIYPDSDIPDNYDARQTSWYTQAHKDTNNVIITQPYTDTLTQKQVVAIVKAVESDGQVTGVVGVDCSLEHLSDTVSSNTIGNTGVVYVVDKDGDILASPDKSDIGQKYVESKGKQYSRHTNEETGWDIIVAVDDTELDGAITELAITNSVAVLIFGFLAILVSRRVSKKLSSGILELKSVITQVANNDISEHVEVKLNDEIGELGQAINKMIDNLREFTSISGDTAQNVEATIESLQATYSEISVSTQDVLTAMQDVANGNLSQLTKTQDSLNELDRFVDAGQAMGISVEHITDLLNRTKELSVNGKNIVDELVENTVMSKQSSEDINSIMAEMSKSMQDIAKVSNMINEVANRTNLLSLNASIEAARAGEQGKGFSVVATEIRKLAEQSKVSTTEINNIIHKVEHNQSKAMELLSVNNKVINEQATVTKETSNIFNTIQESIDENVDEMQGIMEIKDRLGNSAQALAEGINEIAGITEVTAASSEEVTASTDEISQKMEHMLNSMDKLHLAAESMNGQVSKFKTKQIDYSKNSKHI